MKALEVARKAILSKGWRIFGCQEVFEMKSRLSAPKGEWVVYKSQVYSWMPLLRSSHALFLGDTQVRSLRGARERQGPNLKESKTSKHLKDFKMSKI